MELRHLEYFVAVAEELSFTRAAERLTIAQSPVSQQIRKLERELGTDLFDRTTRSVELTDAGRILYAEAVELLAASRRAADNTRLAGQGRLGRLALAFTGSATYELMPLLVRAYAQRFPDVTLEVRSEMLTPAQVGGLLEGSISVACSGRRWPPTASSSRSSGTSRSSRCSPSPTRWPCGSTSN
jgi:DNA-binding transcriptional LysR family regulator